MSPASADGFLTTGPPGKSQGSTRLASSPRISEAQQVWAPVFPSRPLILHLTRGQRAPARPLTTSPPLPPALSASGTVFHFRLCATLSALLATSSLFPASACLLSLVLHADSLLLNMSCHVRRPSPTPQPSMLCSPTISSQHLPPAEMIFLFVCFKFPSAFIICTSHLKMSSSEQTRDCVQLLTMVSLGQNAMVLRKWQNPFGWESWSQCRRMRVFPWDVHVTLEMHKAKLRAVKRVSARVHVCVCVCVKRVESDRQDQPKCRGPLGWWGAPHSPAGLFQGGEAQGSRIPQAMIGVRGGPECPQSGGLGRCAGSQGRKV